MQSFALKFVGPNAFAVVPANINRNGVTFRFDYTQAVWSKIKVNFWASANADIQVGHFEAGIHVTIQLVYPLELTVVLDVLMLIRTYLLHSAVKIIQSSESSLMVTTWIRKVELFKFQSHLQTFKELP